MREYLNDITHQIMEPQLTMVHFHKQALNHFGVTTNPDHPINRKIQHRNNQVDFVEKKQLINPVD